MAQMDAESAAVQKAVMSPAYANLMKVSGDALAMTNWEIHRVRPDLSNPPDGIVNADPSFLETGDAAGGKEERSSRPEIERQRQRAQDWTQRCGEDLTCFSPRLRVRNTGFLYADCRNIPITAFTNTAAIPTGIAIFQPMFMSWS